MFNLDQNDLLSLDASKLDVAPTLSGRAGWNGAKKASPHAPVSGTIATPAGSIRR